MEPLEIIDLDRLDRQIEQLESQLKLLRSMRDTAKKLREMPQGEPSPATRFYGMRPLVAARQVLVKEGKKIAEDELKKMLIAGGITINRKRGIHNVNKGFEISIEIGELTCTGKNRLIGLPEWETKK